MGKLKKKNLLCKKRIVYSFIENDTFVIMPIDTIIATFLKSTGCNQQINYTEIPQGYKIH